MSEGAHIPAGASTGPAIDRQGRDIIDPTKNVLDLVQASVTRLDDLRETDLLYRREIEGIKEARRRSDLEHQRELREAEAARIDAIRAVDVTASQQSAKDAETRASALANQVQASAETLRTTVAATATQSATALAAALDPIQKDIADLRRAQYEAQGQKTQVIEQQSGISTQTAVVSAAVGVLLVLFTIVSLAISIYVVTKK